MPQIKNGQYATILLKKEHTLKDEDIILEDKYYRYNGNSPYTRYKGLDYYLQWVHKNYIALETTGYVEGDETLEYQIENRKLPLLWKDGRTEIRKKTTTILTLDARVGWVADIRLVDGKIVSEPIICIDTNVKKELKRLLKELSPHQKLQNLMKGWKNGT